MVRFVSSEMLLCAGRRDTAYCILKLRICEALSERLMLVKWHLLNRQKKREEEERGRRGVSSVWSTSDTRVL